MYPRDLQGYGARRPDPRWPAPDGAGEGAQPARIAVQFVVNYEEGGENCVLHGDAASEAFLSEIVGAQAWPGQRHWNMESIYDYGARVGFWRLHRLFTGAGVPVTVYGVATALARSPAQVAAMQEAGWEIASHGLKWIEYKDFARDEERAHMREAIRLHEAVTGARPTGWYTGRCSEHTVDLASEEGGFEWVSDAYDDELPYWRRHQGGGASRDQLVIPYTLDCNDMRFATPQGFNSGDQFETYLRDTFDTLYAEGLEGRAGLMNIGLHCRLVGRPGRFAALRRFLDYARARDGVWFARRIDIARHWRRHHPPPAQGERPGAMGRDAFVEAYGSVFEHSPFIAERAFDAGLGPANDTASGLHAALRTQFRLAQDDERLAVLRAHPDLAGKLAAAKRLTAASNAEQASAGLDALTDGERAAFIALNDAYTARFGFPFIIAVRDHDKASILARFQERLKNDRDTEFAAACAQVERIAELRLRERLA